MAHTLDSFPDTGNLENLKDNYQKITSVLAGHQIAFWEYDIPTGECNFTDEYFHILGLKEAGIIFRDINDFYRFAHPEDVISYQTTFARMLESETKISQIVVRCVGLSLIHIFRQILLLPYRLTPVNWRRNDNQIHR